MSTPNTKLAAQYLLIALVAAYLAKGGKITKCPPKGQR
jgi:hypothetical protein